MDAFDLAKELMELFDPKREIWDGLLLAMELLEPKSEICDGVLFVSKLKPEESTNFEFLLPNIILELFNISFSSDGDIDELLRLDSLVGEPLKKKIANEVNNLNKKVVKKLK